MNTNTVDKVVMFLGDSGVGKTSIVSQFIEIEQDDFKRSKITNINKEREKTICKFKRLNRRRLLQNRKENRG